MELNLQDHVQLVSVDQESFCVGMQISCLLQGVCLPFPKLGNTEGRVNNPMQTASQFSFQSMHTPSFTSTPNS